MSDMASSTASRKFDTVDREYIWTYPTSFIPMKKLDKPMRLTAADWGSHNSAYVYVHVPFCKTNCTWCVFYRERHREAQVAAYVDAVVKEIEIYARMGVMREHKIRAIYFGGGTASVLSAGQVRRIIEAIRGLAEFEHDVEITWEGHPRTASFDALAEAREFGVNRVSFGIQSFSGKMLRNLRIAQTPDSNHEALEMAAKAGIPFINMDMIYRIPGQAMEDLERDLDLVANSPVTGVSCYSLEAKDTRFEEGGWADAQPTEESDREMFDLIDLRMKGNGFKRIAQPDFARAGLDCRYLEAIWGAPQAWGIGFGPGALSSEVAGWSYYNVSNLQQYIEAIIEGRAPIAAATKLTCAEAMARYFVLGVRRLEVPLKPFAEQFGRRSDDVFTQQFSELSEAGMVRIENDVLRLTPAGIYFVDNVSKLFYTDACSEKAVPWGMFAIESSGDFPAFETLGAQADD